MARPVVHLFTKSTCAICVPVKELIQEVREKVGSKINKILVLSKAFIRFVLNIAK